MFWDLATVATIVGTIFTAIGTIFTIIIALYGDDLIKRKLRGREWHPMFAIRRSRKFLLIGALLMFTTSGVLLVSRRSTAIQPAQLSFKIGTLDAAQASGNNYLPVLRQALDDALQKQMIYGPDHGLALDASIRTVSADLVKSIDGNRWKGTAQVTVLFQLPGTRQQPHVMLSEWAYGADCDDSIKSALRNVTSSIIGKINNREFDH